MSTQSRLTRWCEGVLEAGWLAALTLAPLFFNVFSSRVFEPDKASLVRSIALVMLLAWVVKAADGGPLWLPAYRRTADGADGEAGDAAPPPRSWRRRFVSTPFLLSIALLVAAYLISNLFSVARFVSWWGSYQRLQGSYTFLSYVVIALLAAAHLRRPEQIRRLQHVVILTSLPIAIYAILQHRDLDPLPWGGDTRTRVTANAGNAIFLAAYLILAFFFTLKAIYSSFSYLLRPGGQEPAQGQDLPAALEGGAYLFVLVVQSFAILWTQSRGPWLGLFAGFYLFVLLTFSALRPRNYKRLASAWVGLGVLAVAALLALNTLPALEPLRELPYVGRLAQLLDPESVTGQVRFYIWEGASRLVAPHEPLVAPDGAADAVNPLRPLVGYGPETMWVGFNRFYPPGLAHVEQRNASPDRAHNETWDSLVITGLLGFVAYISLFIGIFYWALRWLGLLINRRDGWLFAGQLTLWSLVFIGAGYILGDGYRLLGVTLPAGLVFGLAVYVTVAAFLHPSYRPDPQDAPRQLLIVTLLATMVAHFIEIHFGIAIVATRTYFWVYTALLLAVGMRWAHVGPYAGGDLPEGAAAVESRAPAATTGGKKRPRGGRPAAATGQAAAFAKLPLTVMSDLLLFLTFVFIYTTNSQRRESLLGPLFSGVTTEVVSGQIETNVAVLLLMLFTWLVAATAGLVAEALRRPQPPPLGWWLRGYALHALAVWGGWLLYGLVQGRRLIPRPDTTLDQQLEMMTGHFAVFTWLVALWMFGAGIAYAWRWLAERKLPAAGRALVSGAAALVLAVAVFATISRTNIALVRADIIYKQGQQYDNRGEWVNSIDLYRRALLTRTTEDYYMLHLGRTLLELAKRAPAEGDALFTTPPTFREVLALQPPTVQAMTRDDLLLAAEAVLKEAQRVNPLNTDHTANLARLYRSWSDLMTDNPEMRQEMIDRSIAQYDLAVMLSPNAAHLWNEKGNSHLAKGDRPQAEAAYRHSLSLDDRFEQTYLLLADFLENENRAEESVALLEQALEKLPPSTRIYTYLGVALARTGELTRAVEANLDVLELTPADLGAMRNLAIIYRDMGQPAEAARWAEQAAASTQDAAMVQQMRTLAADSYAAVGQIDQAAAQYESLLAANAADTAALRGLAGVRAAQGDGAAAAELLQQLVALEPDNYQDLWALAQALQQTGRTEEARAYAEQALALAPEEQRPAITALLETLQPEG